MAQQKNARKIGNKICPSSISRHNSEPNLAKRATLSEFMRWWNRCEVALSARCRRAAPIFPLCHRMLFHRRVNGAQQQQMPNEIKLRQPVSSAVGPPLRLAPPSPSPSSPRYVLSRSGWRDKACPDGDLLPASWFMLSSKDLFCLHQKLQRRIDRRRSVSKANFPFGEANRRRAIILQKYRRFPADLLRRSLSDQHIFFMDPKRDVETAISRDPKGNSWPSPAKASATNASKKRVSFSIAPIIFPPPPSPAADAEGIDETEKERHRFRPPTPPLSHSVPPLFSPSSTPVKPILARKCDPSSSSSAFPSSPISAAVCPTSTAEFRRRINTVTDIGEDDSLCAMDFATFRAWRRGRRLSVNLLNNANTASGANEVENAIDAAKIDGGARVRIVGWAQLVKRILDDCFWQRKGKRGENGGGGEEVAEEGGEGKAWKKALGR